MILAFVDKVLVLLILRYRFFVSVNDYLGKKIAQKCIHGPKMLD